MILRTSINSGSALAVNLDNQVARVSEMLGYKVKRVRVFD